MAKIRLNQERRDMLMRLAVSAVNNTPIDPAIEKRLKDADAEYSKCFKELCTEAMTIYRKAYSPADKKVLTRHNVMSSQTDLYFVNLDTRNVFQVHLFITADYDAKNLPEGFSNYHAMPYQMQQDYRVDRDKAVDKAKVQVAKKLTHSAPAEATDKLLQLNRAFKTAKDELDMASNADGDSRDKIMQDFHALIVSARTYEDVCEIWPEAKKIAGEMAASAQQISIMSEEAVSRIRANMGLRNIASD